MIRTNCRYACTGPRFFAFAVLPGRSAIRVLPAVRAPPCRRYATLCLPANLEIPAFCCPCAFRRSFLHSFARFLLDGTQQKSETLRPHRVRTSRQKLSASTVTSCFFAFNKPLNYIHHAPGMQEIFEMFFAYFLRSKEAQSLEILGFLIALAQHCGPRFP